MYLWFIPHHPRVFYHISHFSTTSIFYLGEVLGHGNSGSGHTDGHVSDKTLYIALNYQNRVEKLNTDTREEIVIQLVELEQAQKRLEYYTTLLEKRQAMVVRIAYFEGLPWDEVAREVGVAVRTVHKIKIRALEQLAGMYQFTGQHS